MDKTKMDKKAILTWIDENRASFEALALEIWGAPELAYQEHEASRLQMEFLRQRGFEVTQKGDMPTAFMAEWGNGGPTIGILGEYDALAGMSQTVSASIEPAAPKAPGHGCGHNLLGVGGLLAVCAVKEVLAAHGVKGTVRYYGCPAEEVLTGKGDMTKAGYFLDGTDVALTWHPNDSSSVTAATLTAMVSAKFRFKGISAHAGGAPEAGRSALDAVELMNVGANYLREHMVAQDRLHYIITNGGLAPNIVPAEAEVWYFARAPHDGELASLWRRLVKVAKGAALMTETDVEIELLGGCYNTLPNLVLNGVLEENLCGFAGPVSYSEEERRFALEIQNSLPAGQRDAALSRMPEGSETLLNATPLPCFDAGRFVMASSDVGDVANIMPTSMVWAATWPLGVPPHSWQAVACAGSSLGLKGMVLAAKTLAGAVYDLVSDPDIVRRAREEFDARRRGKTYRPIGELLSSDDAK